MLNAIRHSGVLETGGEAADTVSVNGSRMTCEEALEYQSEIVSVDVSIGTRGMLLVQAIHEQEDDWDRFLAGVRVEAELRSSGGEQVSEASVGDALNLVVRIADGYIPGDFCSVCFPPCLSFVWGGGQVKMMTIDFEGRDEISIPLAVTSATRGLQHWVICVRNMFDEDRGGNPGQQRISADVR